MEPLAAIMGPQWLQTLRLREILLTSGGQQGCRHFVSLRSWGQVWLTVDAAIFSFRSLLGPLRAQSEASGNHWGSRVPPKGVTGIALADSSGNGPMRYDRPAGPKMALRRPQSWAR